MKYQASNGVFVSWKDLIASSNGGLTGGTGCSTATVDQITTGWYRGGTSKPERKLGAFNTPYYVTGDANFLYVTDSLNNRVVAVPK